MLKFLAIPLFGLLCAFATQAETIYIKNDKGSDTMILRTKPIEKNARPRREFSNEEVLQLAPSSVEIRRYGTPRPPHHKKPPTSTPRPHRQ